jgi:hypothetical protein
MTLTKVLREAAADRKRDGFSKELLSGIFAGKSS